MLLIKYMSVDTLHLLVFNKSKRTFLTVILSLFSLLMAVLQNQASNSVHANNAPCLCFRFEIFKGRETGNRCTRLF